MKLTRRVVEGYLACKYKGYLLISGKSGQLHDLEIVRRELQEGYGPQATAALVAKCRQSPPATTPDLKAGHELILAPTLEDDQTVFEFDALRRLDGDSALGPFHYGPVLFWHRDSVPAAETWLLAAGGLILARHQGVQPKTGTIVCGSSCTVRTVKLTNHYRAVQQLMDSALAMASDSAAPTLRLNDHCGVCEFRDDCRRQALESDDLSLLGKITDKQIGQYRQKGLFTVTALSYTFRARREKTHPKCRPRSLPLHALAIRQQRILVMGRPIFPAADVRIYFDAEGDPECKFNYLLGLLVVKDGQEQMFSLWADDPSQQSRVYNEFFDILGQYPKYTLFHYGTYERTLLRQMRTMPRRKRAVDAVMSASVNVLAPLFSDVYFPTYSNSLKDVARYLGFSWTDPNASGLLSLAWRVRWELTGDDTFTQRLLAYNSDDCRALRMVTEALDAIAQHQPLTPQGTAITVEEVPFEPNSRSWGNPEYLLPDLDHINKCAYFDYQRDRVCARERGRRRRARTKKKWRKKQGWLRPNERHEITAKSCPGCGGTELARVENRVFKKQVFDLTARPSGVMRRVIEYKAVRVRCLNCGRVRLPTKFKRLSQCRHGLRSWAMYQHVAHQVSLLKLVTMLDDFFGLRLNLDYVHMMKSIMVRYYRPTTRRLLRKLLSGHLIHVDETQIKLRRASGYVWVLTNIEEVLFLFRPSREVGFLKELLADFQGVLVSDFYSGYDGMDCRQQKCLIHLMRDMNSDMRLNPFDDELKMLVAQFGVLLRGIVETIDRHGLRTEWLQRHKPKVSAFYDGVCGVEYGSQVAQSLQKRLVKNREKLFTFLECDGIPWNNNNAEHAIKYFAHYRTIAEGHMEQGGLEDYLDLLSIRATCDYKGVGFLPFLYSKVRDVGQFAEGHRRRGRTNAVEVYPRGFPLRRGGKTRPAEGGTADGSATATIAGNPMEGN